MGCTKINSPHKYKINHQLLHYQSNELIQYIKYILIKTVLLSLSFFLLSPIIQFTKLNQNTSALPPFVNVLDGIAFLSAHPHPSSPPHFHSNSPIQSSTMCNHAASSYSFYSFFSSFFSSFFYSLSSSPFSSPYDHLPLLLYIYCVCVQDKDRNIYKPVRESNDCMQCKSTHEQSFHSNYLLGVLLLLLWPVWCWSRLLDLSIDWVSWWQLLHDQKAVPRFTQAFTDICFIPWTRSQAKSSHRPTHLINNSDHHESIQLTNAPLRVQNENKIIKRSARRYRLVFSLLAINELILM